jgi:hypothetical protein
MSIREDIAANIVQALQGITDPNVVLVSRNPINISDLSIAQYPAIIVRSADEDREDAGFGAAGLRISNINYIIHGYVRAESSATSVNNNIHTEEQTN